MDQPDPAAPGWCGVGRFGGDGGDGGGAVWEFVLIYQLFVVGDGRRRGMLSRQLSFSGSIAKSVDTLLTHFATMYGIAGHGMAQWGKKELCEIYGL